MKRLALVLLSLAFAGAVHSQDFSNVRTMKYELGGAMIWGGSTDGYTFPVRREMGGKGYAEVRINLKNRPFDVGIQYGFSAHNIVSAEEGYDIQFEHQHLNSIILFSDYNYRGWKSVSLFAGLGVGVSDAIENLDGGSSSNFKAQAGVRVGAEFFHHIRLTTEYRFSDEDGFSYFGLNLGFVINGGLR